LKLYEKRRKRSFLENDEELQCMLGEKKKANRRSENVSANLAGMEGGPPTVC